ncbi:DUF4157 domain-containing protein [Salinirubrum litoreum]|uniref:DUF4157 domain-containing protein n=1 Tax=Salinirubrum litoreum TaxID=1126234 RepID=A0ABD5RC67_9EURY|nr:DUF4157 domain-containing protein [Salinirubrum litoreum]
MTRRLSVRRAAREDGHGHRQSRRRHGRDGHATDRVRDGFDARRAFGDSVQVSDPTDRAERAATATADRVLAADAGTRDHDARADGESTNETGVGRRVESAAERRLGAELGRGDRLPAGVRSALESRFGTDFGDVRVHTGPTAAAATRALDARAFTVGRRVVFDDGEFAPQTAPGRRLLAHELAHVSGRDEGDGVAGNDRGMSRDHGAGSDHGTVGETIHRQPRGGTESAGGPVHASPSPRIRSPAIEETLRQGSAVLGASEAGRPLTSEEEALARPIFGTSIDLSRVRLVSVGDEERSSRQAGLTGFQTGGTYVTIGNTIYVPSSFTVENRRMAQTLIHELVHVWQYQHGGTGYVSDSAVAQVTGALEHGTRNAAYGYTQDTRTIFEYPPEQQASIVENYFAMLRDRRLLSGSGGTSGVDFFSNHKTSDGGLIRLSAAQRRREIRAELAWHRERVQQLARAVPMTDFQQLQRRTQDLMGARDPMRDLVPEERRLTPLNPLLQIEF